MGWLEFHAENMGKGNQRFLEENKNKANNDVVIIIFIIEQQKWGPIHYVWFFEHQKL